jgi:hypothetical protein
VTGADRTGFVPEFVRRERADADDAVIHAETRCGGVVV